MGSHLPGEGHANLALGKDVRAAGAVQASGGKIILIDNSSGHYEPVGQNAKNAALDAFRREGFDVKDDIYVEKFFDEKTGFWEPLC